MTQAKSTLPYFFFLWAVALFGQGNLVLTFNDPRFHEIIPLYADTAFIKNNTQTREIAYDYDAFNRPVQVREQSRDSVQNQFLKRLGDYIYSPNKLVFTETTEYSGAGNFTTKSRSTVDTIPGTTDLKSVLYEAWDGFQWVNNQMDAYTYFAVGKISEVVSKRWDFNQSVWRNEYSYRYEYDAQGNSIKYTYLNWDFITSDWKVQFESTRHYNASNRLISFVYSAQSGGALTPIDSAVYVYDAAGRIDTIWYFNRLPDPLNQWVAYSYLTLDDAPEYQITQEGNLYRLNGQAQWYLAEKTSFVPGTKIYTDQYAERLFQTANVNTGQLLDQERRLVSYVQLPDKIIKGDFQRDEFKNGSWQTVYHLTAWMRSPQDVSSFEPPVSFKFPSCGLSNPFVPDQLLLGLPQMPDPALVEIFSMDGRQILSAAKDGMSSLSFNLKSAAMYWVVARDAIGQTCVQKIIAR